MGLLPTRLPLIYFVIKLPSSHGHLLLPVQGETQRKSLSDCPILVHLAEKFCPANIRKRGFFVCLTLVIVPMDLSADQCTSFVSKVQNRIVQCSEVHFAPCSAVQVILVLCSAL